MKTIQLTTNIPVIKLALTVDNCYDGLVYDGCPDLENFTPNTKDNVWFLLKEDERVAGLIKLEYLNFILWVPHIVIYKQYRGKGSEEWGKQVLEYMKERIKGIKFLALTPYEEAKRYAERIGFKHINNLNNSIRKNGVLLNQYMLELGVDE